MVVSDEVQELLDGPWSTGGLARRANRLRADLEMFVRGQVLGISMTPYRHKSAYMGLLDPPERGFWDIRSRDPKPALRVLGHFADVDLFVALVWQPAWLLRPRLSLAGPPPLAPLRLRCLRLRRRLLPPIAVDPARCARQDGHPSSAQSASHADGSPDGSRQTRKRPAKTSPRSEAGRHRSSRTAGIACRLSRWMVNRL